jgi:hypothetical protein
MESSSFIADSNLIAPTQNFNFEHLEFEAKTTLLDKVNRVANNLVFGAALCGVYMFATGGTGLGGTGLACYAAYLAMALTARKIASTTIGYIAYPAAANSLLPRSKQSTDLEGIAKRMQRDGYIVKNISLYKSGVKYDGLIVTHENNISNSKWTINALGNGMNMQDVVDHFAAENFSNEFNTLIINGPSVGQSGGWPTRYQMGAGFEAGLQYLEQKAQATHIIMHGFSLGGGMMAEAILNHDFAEGQKKNIQYLSISDRSFSRLSTAAGAIIGEAAGMALGKIVELIFYITGTELDGVRAAQRLSQLNIKQIVIQHNGLFNQTNTDDVIPDSASLAYELGKEGKEGMFKDKVFIESEEVSHNFGLPNNLTRELKHNIKKFRKNS